MTDPRDLEMPAIFHIALASEWAAAAALGTYRQSTRGASLADVGFIHASFEHQLPAVASFVYRDVDEPLVVLTIDTARLDVPVIVENADGSDERFPHIYGPLPTNAVIAVRSARMTSDGVLQIDTPAT